MPAAALRAVVPLMCTDNSSTYRTFVRGTGLIAGSDGTLVTAAHVVLQVRSSCTLSVMVPADDWIRADNLQRFVIIGCHSNEVLDIAVCHIQPADKARDLQHLRAASLGFRSIKEHEPVRVTGFSGWLPTPATQAGHITGQENYRTQGRCRCDFALDIAVVAGMSGSPVISDNGEVLGIITLAGTGRFRGTSFGISFAKARGFLTAEGVVPFRTAQH